MNKKSAHGNEVRQKIYDYLVEKQVTIAPVSFREICNDLGIPSTSVVNYHLSVLEQEGKIERSRNEARQIKVKP